MARFNLEDYETVEERLKKLYATHEDARVKTKFIDLYQNDGPRIWVVKSYIFLTAGDQAANLPKATGYASEVESGTQAQWALELAETSSIGRALANMNLSGNKRASREEMQKVAKAEPSHAAADWLAKLDELTTAEEIRQLYADARRSKAPAEVLDQIATKGKSAK